MSNIIGVRNNNTIVPYSASTRRTKQLDISEAVTSSVGTISSKKVNVIFYADSAGNWWATGNLIVTYTGDVNLSGAGDKWLTLSGISFVTSPVVIESLNSASAAQFVQGECQSTGRIAFATASTTVQYLRIAFNAPLSVEPTTYTTAANMEGVPAVDVYIEPASATEVGLVTTGAQSFAGNKTLTGFTSLGGGVAVKCKRLTGTTASAENTAVTVAHGLSASKIVGFQAMVRHSATGSMVPEFTAIAEYQYSIYLEDNTNFRVTNSATNSANILSKDIEILVWYIE